MTRTANHLRMAALLAAVVLFASAAQAELTIEITEGVADPIPIAVVPFGWTGSGQAPYDVAEVVAGDLQRSGLFSPMSRGDMIDRPSRSADVRPEDWRLLRNDYVVVGQLQPQAPGSGEYVIQFEVINVLNGQHLLSYRQPATSRNFRAASHKVADLVFEKLTGIRGAFSTRIAYVSVDGQPPKQRYQLIVADADGENPRVVAQSAEPIMSPAWSPDGGSLAYVSFEDRVASIYTQLLRTGERRRVSARAGINGAPAWSPDGRRLALTLSQRDGNMDIYILNLANQNLTRLTRDNAIDTEPAWSPDGDMIYFTSDRSGGPQIYRIDAGGGSGEQARRVTFEGSYNARPRVSPNGERLAVVTLDRGAYRIGLVDLKRGGLQVLTKGRNEESPSFAPNGAMLIYATQEGGRSLLATVSIDGRVHQRLGANSAGIREPVWSPL